MFTSLIFKLSDSLFIYLSVCLFLFLSVCLSCSLPHLLAHLTHSFLARSLLLPPSLQTSLPASFPCSRLSFSITHVRTHSVSYTHSVSCTSLTYEVQGRI